ncbi:MAG: hypothetical protein ACRDJP_14040 [Actinomycetota bacterium]
MENMADKARTRWAQMGGKLGMLFAGLGFLLMVVGWNGAAGLDYVQGQIPYVISGGLIGLGLVIFGAVLLVIESNRRDRMLVERRLEDLAAALTRASAPPAEPAEPEKRERPLRRAN